jgi:hypothetical protein
MGALAVGKEVGGKVVAVGTGFEIHAGVMNISVATAALLGGAFAGG